MMIFWPLALVVGFVVFSRRASDSGGNVLTISGAEAAWNSPTTSPIAVLSAIMAAGKTPPGIVVDCAIAQAQTIGRGDLAAALHQRFYGVPNFAAAVASALPVAPSTQAQAQAQAQAQPQAQPAITFQIQSARTQPSPLPNVSSGAWSEFSRRLEREAPTFDNGRHVGRYRMNKQRVAELGFDPSALVGAPEVQDQALVADVSDAYHHVLESGMADDCIGKPISWADDEEPQQVTLSGVLGVAAAAGLDGAAGWFENKEDRKRYPHTTKAFKSTNGVF